MTMNEKETRLSDYLSFLFNKHNLKLVDVSEYEDDEKAPLDIPAERQVSHKWLARRIAKHNE